MEDHRKDLPQQLLDIFRSLCAQNGYPLSPAAQETAAARQADRVALPPKDIL